jgi:hypothetical protein
LQCEQTAQALHRLGRRALTFFDEVSNFSGIEHSHPFAELRDDRDHLVVITE